MLIVRTEGRACSIPVEKEVSKGLDDTEGAVHNPRYQPNTIISAERKHKKRAAKIELARAEEKDQ
jgi:hypothetical protein